MNAYELFTCDYFLTSYDSDATFNQVLNDVLEYKVDVWERFEDQDNYVLVSMMKDMVRDLTEFFIPRGV